LRRRKLNIGIFGPPNTSMADLGFALEPYLVREIICQPEISPMAAINEWASIVKTPVNRPCIEMPGDEPIPQIAARRARVRSILDHSDLILIDAEFAQKKPDLFEIILRSKRPTVLFWRQTQPPIAPGQLNLLGQEVQLEPQLV